MTSVQEQVHHQPALRAGHRAVVGQPGLSLVRPVLTAVRPAARSAVGGRAGLDGAIAEWLETIEVPADSEVKSSLLGPGCAVAMVESGGISVRHPSGDGRLLMSLVLPGDLVQLPECPQGETSWMARTWTDTRIGVLSADTARNLFAEQPELALTLIKMAAAETGRVRQQYLDLAFRDVSGRVAKLLLLLDRVEDNRLDERRVDHGLTQSDMAKIVAASRETVNKALSDFARRGWIVLEERAFWLLDRPALERRIR